MDKSRKIYTYLFPIIIVLNGYASGIEGLSIGSILMNLFNIYALVTFFVKRRKVDIFFVRTACLLFVFLILSCFAYLFYGIHNPSSVVIAALKILTWFLGITITSRMLFDYLIFKSYYMKFCVACTIYLFLQLFLWRTFQIYLPNLFDFGPLHPLYEQYSSESYVNYLSALGFGRFSSFFPEPAHYGIMMVTGLIIMLFDSSVNDVLSKKIRIQALILILGIWCSTSTGSIIFAIIILFFFFFKANLVNKFLLLIITLCIGIAVGFYFHNSEEITFFLNKVSNMEKSARVGQSYFELANFSLAQMTFGVGLGNIEVVTKESKYINVVAGLIMQYGIIGFMFFLWYMFLLFKKENSTALHVLIIISLAAMSQGGHLFSFSGILMFSVAQNLKSSQLQSKEFNLLG